jgi:hypothetical protein
VLILVVLGLLLLPALQKVSDRNQTFNFCISNLQQIGLAVHYYQTARKGKLPTGTIVGSAKNYEDRLSHLVWLLPYLNHELLYKQLNVEQGWESETNKPVVAQGIGSFHCYAARHNSPGLESLTDYVGIAGVGEDAATLPAKHPRAGVFGYDRQLNVSDLADGASQTLMFAETRKNNGPWAAGGRGTLHWIDPAEAAPFHADGSFGSAHTIKPYSWSRRQPVSNIVLADGSVRAVSADISPEVLAALATVAGGEAVPADW